MDKNKKTKKGSILAYSLIILAMMMAIATSLSVSTIIEKKSASGTEFSVQSLQTADSGMQLALKKINNTIDKTQKLSVIFPACGNGDLSYNQSDVNVLADSVNISFYDAVKAPLLCDKRINEVGYINSIGTYKNTVRVVSVAVSAIDFYTKLLLHADGGGVNFADSSTTLKTIINNGATQSPIESKFGGKSAKFNGSSDYLNTVSSPDFDFGTGDFTIDFWENSSSSSRQHAFSFGQASVTNIDFDFNDPDVCNGSPKGIWVYWNSGGSNKICAGATNAYTDGTWHHIALVRQANVMTLYVDGNSVGSTPYAGAINLAGAATYYIGAWGGGNFYWNGYMDEIRVSKGIARWSGNFTPSTTPY